MDIAQRIAQFENMANADPSNEMAHFSLGRAYVEAGRFADGAASYLRCVNLVPDMSKAFQMAGDALIKADQKDRAAEVLSKGYEVAAKKGDRMPRDAMAELLKSIDKAPPEVRGAPTDEQIAATGSFICTKTGRPGKQLPAPPFRGPVGKWILENISAETWHAWIGQGTKVINELRLDLSREQDSETYDKYMREYLGIDDTLLTKLRNS
jgi:Fe-S cluster biosynthesis and repair protein YggX